MPWEWHTPLFEHARKQGITRYSVWHTFTLGVREMTLAHPAILEYTLLQYSDPPHPSKFSPNSQLAS